MAITRDPLSESTATKPEAQYFENGPGTSRTFCVRVIKGRARQAGMWNVAVGMPTL